MGAEPGSDGVHFRVWAPKRRRVSVAFEGSEAREVPLEAEGATGYFSGLVGGARAGDLYRFRLDGARSLYPDPASRFQPEGPHGPSRVVDPHAYRWRDRAWRGVGAKGQVLYEMHVGTFTPEGTLAAARAQLPALAELGVTVLELLPLADFSGRFGWGYDGVNLWAPTRLYGEPDDLRRFVDEAHALGLGVLLDVVYNHFGPDGNYVRQFADEYFTDKYKTEWGEPINFEGPRAVREFFVENAAYWVDEFHFDGLRLDATQCIFDRWEDHVISAVQRAVREAAGGRQTLLVAENEPQKARLVRPEAKGGCGLDALWNDDFHHAARVALTGRNEAYYSDYRGSPQELLSALRWGYLMQGQRSRWQDQGRGSPALDVPAHAFVTFLQNHDQVANGLRGDRLTEQTSPGRLRALTAALLLGPPTPMLFQGQEFAAPGPFCYFADFGGELGEKVGGGRAEFLAQFPAFATPEARAALPGACAEETFRASKMDLELRREGRHAAAWALHRDLIALRRRDPAFGSAPRERVHGAVVGPEAFALRFLGEGGAEDRLLVVNLGLELRLEAIAEPLMAPPEGAGWRVLWSSEDPRYGGHGTPEVYDVARGFFVPGQSAVVLAPRAAGAAT
ncbi:MAG TPA: malto-oligosyltrehalose trehalohydrolase [Polyangiaceae bacterium]|nr:malto-oligosyltrehalose trehalohydrolase [Polyangiaceae bacterium]